MKKTILILCLLVAACGPAYNQMACRQAVIEEFQSAEVVSIGDSKFKFIVRDKQGNVWYAETMNTNNTNVTTKTILFAAK